MFRTRTSAFRSPRACRAATSVRRARLWARPLEDRTVPATFTVTNTTDGPVAAPGDLPGSLRQAIFDANALAGADDIVFDATFNVAKTIKLTNATLVVTDPLTITGKGQKLLTIDGDKLSNVFFMNLAALDAVTVSGLTVTNGKLTGNTVGAGIGTQLTNLVLNNVAITNCTSEAGGTGLFVGDGSVVATGCSFTGNNSSPTGTNFNVGAGASVNGTATGTFTNCIFDNNKSVGISPAFGFAGALAANSTGAVVMDGCTITNNTCNANGGALVVFDVGDFTLKNSTLSNNTAPASAAGALAIGNGATGTITLENVTAANNSSGNAGGVIAAFGDNATINLVRSTFTGNSGPGGGAFIVFAAYFGNINITESTFDGNSSGNLGGGALHLQGAYTGTLTIQGSTFSNNTATGQSGGAIFFSPNAGLTPGVVISNSTFQGNTTTGNGGAIRLTGLGGGYGGSAAIRNSTFTGNSAAGTGGGLGVTTTGAGLADVDSTIVATNKAGGSFTSATADISNTVVAGMTVDFSLVGVVPGAPPFGGANNKTGTTVTPLDPQLLALNFYGGPTKTRIPQPSSPAVNAGSNPAALANDQRGPGFPRSFGGGVDIGATEANNPTPFITGSTLVNVTEPCDTIYTFTITFADSNAINVSTLSTPGAVTVTGPGGFSTTATFVSVDVNTNGTPRTATFSIVPPGGIVDLADNGTYTVNVVGGKIFDTDPTPLSVPSQKVGTFVIAIAQMFVVNATNDESSDTDGKVSLREALQLANLAPGADSISFDPTVFAGSTTVTLTGSLSVTDSVTILAQPAGLTLDAATLDRHMGIAGPGTLNVSVSGITFINGLKSGLFAGFDGGSVSITDENVTFANCVFKNNSTSINGGAVAQIGNGNLTFISCVFEANSVVAGGGFFGGAVFYGGTNTVTVTDTTFTGNQANDGPGGAIAMGAAGTLNVTSSTVSGNNAVGAGGGIYFFNGGTLNLTRSTVSGNTAGTVGGGIYMYQPTGMTLTNSTISGNTAGGEGGGVYLNKLAVPITIQNSTLTLNTSNGLAGGGGGVFLKAVQPGGTLTLSSTIVAGNINGQGPDVASDAAFSVGGNNNLIGVADLGNITYTGVGNKNGTSALPQDPLLGALGANGGPTQTHLPLAGSIAINNGNNTAGLASDQRGFARVVGGVADIGAAETAAATVTGPTVTTVAVNGGGAQRSMVTSIVVTFSEPVNFPSGILSAFQLNRIGQPTGGPSASAPLGAVNLFATQSGNQVTLTFLAGGAVGLDPARSLIDGLYQLTVVASKVAGVGGNMAANFQTPAAGAGRITRLFGDSDGDGDTDAVDYGQFRGAFGGVNDTFDYDGDCDADSVDFGQFRQRFGVST